MAIPTLPSDTIIDILSRLPSKTLIRFKSVSKQWYSLINSPNFINLHLSQTLISQNPLNLIISQLSISSIAISDEDNPNFHLIELYHPLKHLCNKHNIYIQKNTPQIHGSINGVVCISMYHKSSVVLYNPSTKTHRFVPPFTSSPNTNPNFGIILEKLEVNLIVFGLGFDSVRGDYRVVRMIETFKLSELVYREASVYSLNDDSWKLVSDQTMAEQFVLRNGKGVLVNESLHFIGNDINSNPKIKCFNLRTETFSILDLPKYDEEFSRITLVIKELGGCFSVLVNCETGMEGNCALARADLWVMKEHGNNESWFRLFSIRDLDRLDVLIQVKPVVYSRDKERILLELDNLWFGWYSWGSKSFERITVHGLPSACAPCNTWTFVDSLVSIGKDKDKSCTKEDKNKMDCIKESTTTAPDV